MFAMRVVFLAVAVCAIFMVNAAPSRGKAGNAARAMAMFNACKGQAKVTQADLEILEKKEVPTTKTGKCFIACMMEKGGIMKNGKYDKTRATRIARKVFSGNQSSLQEAMTVIDTCDKQANSLSDKCEVAAKLAQCMNQHNLADIVPMLIALELFILPQEEKRREMEVSDDDDQSS